MNKARDVLSNFGLLQKKHKHNLLGINSREIILPVIQLPSVSYDWMVPIFLTALVNILRYSSLHNFLKKEIAAENSNSSQNSTLTVQVFFKVL